MNCTSSLGKEFNIASSREVQFDNIDNGPFRLSSTKDDGQLSISEFNKKYHTGCLPGCHFGWHDQGCKRGLNRTWLGYNSRDGRDYCANNQRDRSSNVRMYTCGYNGACGKPKHNINSPNILETFDFSFVDNISGTQQRMCDFNPASLNTWYTASGSVAYINKPRNQPRK